MSNWPRVCHFKTLLFGSEFIQLFIYLLNVNKLASNVWQVLKGSVNRLKIYYNKIESCEASKMRYT